MNPSMLFKLTGLWNRFTNNHPKFPGFLKAVQNNGIKEGTIIEVKIIQPTGEVIESNIKVKADDLELFESLKQMK